MSTNEQASSANLDALRERFDAQSRRAQAYYNVMHAIAGVLGSNDAGNDWMNGALPALGGMTPAEAVGAGREAELLQHIATMKGAHR